MEEEVKKLKEKQIEDANKRELEYCKQIYQDIDRYWYGSTIRSQCLQNIGVISETAESLEDYKEDIIEMLKNYILCKSSVSKIKDLRRLVKEQTVEDYLVRFTEAEIASYFKSEMTSVGDGRFFMDKDYTYTRGGCELHVDGIYAITLGLGLLDSRVCAQFVIAGFKFSGGRNNIDEAKDYIKIHEEAWKTLNNIPIVGKPSGVFNDADIDKLMDNLYRARIKARIQSLGRLTYEEKLKITDMNFRY